MHENALSLMAMETAEFLLSHGFKKDTLMGWPVRSLSILIQLKIIGHHQKKGLQQWKAVLIKILYPGCHTEC